MIDYKKYERFGWKFGKYRNSRGETLITFKSPRMDEFKCSWLTSEELTDNFLLDSEKNIYLYQYLNHATQTYQKELREILISEITTLY